MFLFALADHLPGGLTLIGRDDPSSQPYPYPVPDAVGFAGLPFYPSLRDPMTAAGPLLRGLRALWGAVGAVDVVFVLGPNPLALACVVFGLVRRRRVVLGVRQDLPPYVRRRHPGRRGMAALADAMELVFRALARVCPTAVVGEDLAARYRRARALHPMHVSLVPAASIVAERPAARDSFSGRLLSVGRLDEEKNPLLMAEVVALLCAKGGEWVLDVFGDGALAEPLARRAAELGVGERVRLHGYVPFDGRLQESYATADAMLHVSWTEGMPQVLLEAFAARLPVVATAVGGVRAVADGAALLIPPGDAAAAATALERLGTDPLLRERLAAAGTSVVRAHTMEAESARLAGFLTGAGA